jgi:hypothetical protein
MILGNRVLFVGAAQVLVRDQVIALHREVNVIHLLFLPQALEELLLSLDLEVTLI